MQLHRMKHKEDLKELRKQQHELRKSTGYGGCDAKPQINKWKHMRAAIKQNDKQHACRIQVQAQAIEIKAIIQGVSLMMNRPK